jgi:small subunit ribosomal protein S4e
MPLLVILRNRLKYALTSREVTMILRQRLVKVDDTVRTDPKYPAGFMDVIEIPRSGDRFRLLYDVKGRFTLVKIDEKQAKIKLCKVARVWTTTGRVPVLTTTDGHRIRYPDPRLAKGDSFIYNIHSKKIISIIKLRAGKIVMVSGGANRGRIGEILSLERHPGAFDIVHLKDKNGNEFATRATNVFVIGKDYKSIPVTLPKQAGIKQNPTLEREEKLIAAENRRQAHAQAQRVGGMAGKKTRK